MYNCKSSLDPDIKKMKMAEKKYGKEHFFKNLRYLTIILGITGFSVFLYSKISKNNQEDEFKDFEQNKKNNNVVLDYNLALRDENGMKAHKKSLIQMIIYKILVLFRFFYLGILFSPLIFFSSFAYVFPTLRPKYWYMVVRFFEKAGGCWIKLGQWATTRPDIFPTALMDELVVLQDHCPSHSFEQTKEIIKKNYNVELEDLFDEFGQVPLASGTIAQVHKAYLKISGESVAIKVLHPGIETKIQIDLEILDFFAMLFSLNPSSKWMGLRDSVQQFANTMTDQLDMRLEARNLMRFNQNFKDNKYVIFPHVIDHMSTKEVLVESFEFGQSLNAFLKSSNIKEREKLAKIGLKTYLTMLLVDNFIHCDMHPGNLMVRSTNEKDLKLIILDAGLISELGKSDWLNFKGLFKCVVKGDGKTGAKMMVENAKQTYIKDDQIDFFTNEMEKLFSDMRNNKISDIQIGRFLTDVFNIVRKYKVKIDNNFTTLSVGTVVLEGIGKQLDPDINILEQSLPLLIWSEKADLDDRMVFIKEKLKDEFQREDTQKVPYIERIYHIMKPFFDSLKSI